MKQGWQIAGAFVGIIVGAGFASGQEILQYFTSFGAWSIAGSLVAMVVFAFLGKHLAQLGTDLQTVSHKDVIYLIGGRVVGTILDVLITFFLFGVAAVMFAGSGAAMHQTFGMSPTIGSSLLALLTVLTLVLNIENLIKVIGAVTPYLLGIIFVILVYSMFTSDLTFTEQHELAVAQPAAAPNWLLGALLYVSYNLAAGAALLIVMGGTVKDRRVSGFGGGMGGFIAGMLILLINLAMLMKMDVVSGYDMPTLALAEQIHPAVGTLMSIALIGMMYNTAVGMLYAFTVRFFDPNSQSFKWIIVTVGVLGFFASLVGFTSLVGQVYAAMGYIGFALMIGTLWTIIKRRHMHPSNA